MIKYAKLKINFIDWIVIPIICSIISHFIITVFNFNFVSLINNLIMNIVLFILCYILLLMVIQLCFYLKLLQENVIFCRKN